MIPLEPAGAGRLCGEDSSFHRWSEMEQTQPGGGNTMLLSRWNNSPWSFWFSSPYPVNQGSEFKLILTVNFQCGFGSCYFLKKYRTFSRVFCSWKNKRLVKSKKTRLSLFKITWKIWINYNLCQFSSIFWLLSFKFFSGLGIPLIAHLLLLLKSNERLWAIPSERSRQMSDRERIAR